MKTEAFGKALLPRPQSTVRYHSTNGHERQVGLLEDRVQSWLSKSTNARLMKSDVNELMGPLIVEAHHQLHIQGWKCE
jgi:cytochrome c